MQIKKNQRRIDRYKLDSDWTLTPEGYLRVTAFATRTGVFPYTQGDGSVVKELRIESEVFDEKSFKTLNDKPVTWHHPEEMVNANNWATYARGYTHNDAQKENNFLKITLTVSDQSLVKAIQNNELREVSCGYQCDFDPTPGFAEGQAYDGIQRNIIYNHLAVVPAGRAGPEVRLKLDAAELEYSEEKKDVKKDVGKNNRVGKGDLQVTKVPFNFKGFSLDVEASQIQTLTNQIKKDEMSMSDLEAAVVELKAKVESLLGEKAVSDEEAKKVAAELEAAKDSMTEEKVDALINSRIAFKEKAKLIVDNKVKFDGKSEKEIMLECLKSRMPSLKLDGKSDDFIKGAFDSLVVQAPQQKNNEAHKFNVDGKNDEQEFNLDSLESFQKEQHKKLKNLWQTNKKQA